jgi:hypothetical protein
MTELAERLLQKAKSGNLPWQKAQGKDAYLVSFPEVTITISRLSWLPSPPPAPPGLPPLPDLRKISTFGYRLELFESGAMIGSFAATGGDPEHKLLRQIFELAEGLHEGPEGEEHQTEVGIDKALEYLQDS